MHATFLNHMQQYCYNAAGGWVGGAGRVVGGVAGWRDAAVERMALVLRLLRGV